MNRIVRFTMRTALVPIVSVVMMAHADAQERADSGPARAFPSSIMVDDPADSIHPDSPTPELKSENTALAYSLTGTLMPIGTIILAGPGLIVGPSLGYFYAGMPGRAWSGIGLRILGVGGMASSFIICGWDCGPGQSGYNEAWAVFLASAGIVTVSAVYDIATVKAAVRKRNDSFMKLADTVTPVYFAESRAFGVKLVYHF